MHCVLALCRCDFKAGQQVPRLVASYQANFVNGALFFVMCTLASGAEPPSILPLDEDGRMPLCSKNPHLFSLLIAQHAAPCSFSLGEAGRSQRGSDIPGWPVRCGRDGSVCSSDPGCLEQAAARRRPAAAGPAVSCGLAGARSMACRRPDSSGVLPATGARLSTCIKLFNGIAGVV